MNAEPTLTTSYIWKNGNKHGHYIFLPELRISFNGSSTFAVIEYLYYINVNLNAVKIGYYATLI